MTTQPFVTAVMAIRPAAEKITNRKTRRIAKRPRGAATRCYLLARQSPNFFMQRAAGELGSNVVLKLPCWTKYAGAYSLNWQLMQDG